MKIALITCIKNEEDVIYNNLLYYYNMGIRNFYVMLNNSQDNTISELERFERNKNVKIRMFFDTKVEYLQPARFTMMANEAFRDGCTWIIPIDADEIFKINSNHKNFSSFFEQFDKQHQFGYINCEWIDYTPDKIPSKKHDGSNIFSTWKHRMKQPRKEHKVIVKWHPEMKFGDGHHLVISKRNLIYEGNDIFCAHFFGRSYDQFSFKIRNISNVFAKTFGKDSQRGQVGHFHQINEKGEDFIKSKWDEMYNKRINSDKIFDPIPKEFFLDK